MNKKALVFPQLFIKSNHSLFESTISMEEIIEFSLKNNHKHSFFTESQEIKHFPTFHLKASQKGLIPLLSLHYIWKNSSEWLLIPKNFEGYQFLCNFLKNISLGEEKWDEIIKIFISGDENIKPWKDDIFYLSNSECPKGIFIRENLFLKKEDYELYSLITAIKNKSNYSRELELNRHLSNSYLLNNEADNKNIYWTKNLINILKECKYYFLRSPLIEEKHESITHERKEIIFYCSSELEKYTSKFPPESKKQYQERFQRELNLFDSKGYWEYFSIIWAVIKYLTSSNILMGPGRGSSCSSLIIFLLGINKIDPIKYGLLLDRFLTESSNRLPDLDIDIEGSKRVEVLNFLKNTYGEKNFIVPSILKKIKNVNLISPTLSKVFPEWENKHQLLSKLIDIPFLIQAHPSSIIPLLRKNSIFLENTYKEENSILPITPLEYNTTSYILLQKFDLLSSQYLEFLSEVIKKVGLTSSQLFEIDFLNKNTWELLNKGLTYYLFHLDSPYIKSIIPLFKLETISDLAQLLAIIRPGINKHISAFLNYKSPNNIFFNQTIKNILCETRGIILFQEQVMLLIFEITGMQLSNTDKYRIALQKQKMEELENLKKEFFQLALENKRNINEIQKSWDFINTFGKYSFNKSHAVAYATLSFQAAYLKANYSEIFFISAIKREGLSKNCLNEIISLGYQIKLSNCLKKVSYTGFFDTEKKIFYIGLNGIKFGALQLFQMIEKNEKELKENVSHLEAAISFLLSKGITKEDIQKLNYLNWFEPIFSKGENSLFLEYYWDLLYKKIVFGNTENEKNFSFSEDEKKSFLENRDKNLNFEWNDYFSDK
ncbi:PHP domain-containing protein [Mycoplasma parvum]|uniref:Uncharacterized protein n=1 Tax=Mycoplasma parvum str. Indiana TaxID=1403316 RepID=U5NCS4_9MOLU|nr:PHP domain-containing protein [Mycoplasma parvum]AGX89232.1 hypothetical protein PRV_02480 [Mycoplasma parvum str. Indiana]